MKAIRTITPTTARHLFIAQQRLAGPRPPANAAGIMEVVRDLGCLQLDPISAVARSHMLVLWSRLGPYDRAHLDTLMWQERKLFEYWAHAASIVLTEDYAIHNLRMRRYGKADSTWHQRIRAWMEKNDALRRHIKTELRRNGPLPSRALQEQGLHPLNWVSSGWTSERNI